MSSAERTCLTQDHRNYRLAAAAMVSVVIASAVASLLWLALEPPVGTYAPSADLLPSIEPTEAFPQVSHERERFFALALVGSVALLAVTLPCVAVLLRRLSPRVNVTILITAQLVIGFSALAVLYTDDTFGEPGKLGGGVDMLGWGAGRFWWGVALTALTVVAVALGLRFPRLASWAPWAAWIVVALYLPRYLLAIVATPASVIDHYDAAIVTNELLSAAGGNHPLTEFAAAYTNLYPELAAVLVRVGMSPEAAAMLVIGLLLCLVVLSIFALFRVVGLKWAYVALLSTLVIGVGSTATLVLPLTLANGETIETLLTTFGYPQLVAMRVTGPFVLGLAVVMAVRYPSGRILASCGFLAGLVFVNNLDLGFGAAVAAGATLAASVGRFGGVPTQLAVRRGIRALLSYLAGVAVALLTVAALVLLFTGQPPDLLSITHYARVFGGSNIIALPMVNVWGLHLAVIGTYAVAVVIALVRWASGPSFKVVNEDRQSTDRGLRGEQSLTAALFFFAAFGFVLIIYYLNRPVLPTLIGSSFLVWAIELALLAIVVVRAQPWSRRALLPGAVLFAVAASIVFAQAYFAPPLTTEITRLQEGHTDGSQLAGGSGQKPLTKLIKENSSPGEEVIVLAPTWSNTVALNAGVRNIAPTSMYPYSSTHDIDRLRTTVTKNGYPTVFIETGSGPEAVSMLAELGYSLRGTSRNGEFQLYARS